MTNATRPQFAQSYGVVAHGDGLLSWEWVETRLLRDKNYWISTVRPDGTPHATPVSGIWLEGSLYFGGDRKARRSRNLEANPHVSVHLGDTDEVVIVEGVATEVVDAASIQQVGQALADKFGDPIMLTLLLDAGNMLYKVTPRVVFAWRETDFANTATRWVFQEQK